MTIFGYTPAQIKKALVSATGGIIIFLTVATPYVPSEWLPLVVLVLGSVTTISVALAKNAEVPPTPPFNLNLDASDLL